MFFWFSNDTFSIIDALTKLILVITGSALIICFCHKLTNFKKSRRYKYDFVRQQTTLATGVAGVDHHQLGAGAFRQHQQQQQQTRWPTLAVDANGSCTTAPFAAAYDPYNSLRPALGGAGQTNAYLNNQPFNQALGTYVGYHHPNSALAAYQGLSALSLSQQQQANGTSNVPAAAAANPSNDTAQQQAQVYSTLVRPDCSGFQARQLDDHSTEDACPSYEEAVRGNSNTNEATISENNTGEQQENCATVDQADQASTTADTCDGAVASAPIKLAPDFPSFAFSLLANEQLARESSIVAATSPLEASSLIATPPLFQRASSTGRHFSSQDEDEDAEFEATVADDAAAALTAAGSISDLLVPSGQNGSNQGEIQSSALLPRVIELNYDNLNQELGPSVAKLESFGSPTNVGRDEDDDEDEDDGNPAAGRSATTADDARPPITLRHDSNSGLFLSSHPHHHKSFLQGAARSRGGHFIHLPNGQSVQFCDTTKAELKCDDDNAICKLGACVCKPGYYLNKQSSWCQSISDLMQNCDNDLQCQAINVDLVCDSKNSERPVCDCVPGLFFDQETHACLPCHRNTFILTTSTTSINHLLESNKTQATNSTMTTVTNSTILSANILPANGTSISANQTMQASGNATSAANQTQQATTQPPAQLRPCRPVDLAKLGRRKQKLYGLFPFVPQYDDSGERLQMLANGGVRPTSSTQLTSSSPSPASSSSSSDPFRIKTPIEVFMGAIMLFTLFTVTWFFLQRIIHDCRTIMRTIRHAPDLASCDPNFTGTFTTTTTGHLPVDSLDASGGGHHHHDSSAAARLAAALAANGADYIETTPGFFTRRAGGAGGYMATTLTGAYHRSLAASLMAATTGSSNNSATNPTGTATTTTLSPSSHNLTGAAVTTNGTNSNSSSTTRSAITRLVGDDTTDSDLVASIYPFIQAHSGANSTTTNGGYATTGLSQRDLTQAQEATARLLAAGARAGEHHPGLAIWRVAMAQSRFNYSPGQNSHQFAPGCIPINCFNPAFDPPPKYEEAIAQDSNGHMLTHLATLAQVPTSPSSSQGSTPINGPGNSGGDGGGESSGVPANLEETVHADQSATSAIAAEDTQQSEATPFQEDGNNDGRSSVINTDTNQQCENDCS